MTLQTILEHYDLNDSFLLGFYGGGNYGDELLLEILQHHLHDRGYQRISFLYQNPNQLASFHHDFGYQAVNAGVKLDVLRAVLGKKTIVVGGGGLWGMDINANVLMMSLLLLIARRLLGKKVLLIGVGYYQSTSRLGHLGAWCAAKAANHIVARDPETAANFGRINKHTRLDKDIAWTLPDLDLADYQPDLTRLERQVKVRPNSLFITLRHFKPGYKQSFDAVVEHTIKQNPGRPVIVALLEPRTVDPHHWEQLQQWRDRFDNVQIIDFSFNPIALYLFFGRHQRDLTYIGPQFHAILTAHLTGVPFMPISYDNKVQALLNDLGISDVLPIHTVEPSHVAEFLTTNLART